MERQLDFHGLQNVSGVAAFSQTTEVDGDQKRHKTPYSLSGVIPEIC